MHYCAQGHSPGCLLAMKYDTSVTAPVADTGIVILSKLAHSSHSTVYKLNHNICKLKILKDTQPQKRSRLEFI